MIEIVFSESAEGSLKVAQSYGRGKYPGGAFSGRVESVSSSAAEGHGHLCKNVCGRMDRVEGRECSAVSCD